MYGVNVSYLDGWVLPYQLEQLKNNGPVLEMLWSQHVDHRHVFPRLVAWPILLLTGYDSRALLVVSWLGTLVILFVFCSASSAVERPVPGALWPAAVTSLLLFSFVHYQTWSWGWLFMLILTNAACCAGIGIWCYSRLAPRTRLIAAIGLFTVSSFSVLHGFVGWVVAAALTPVVILPGRRRKYALILMVCLIGCATGYAYGLQRPESAPDPYLSLSKPLAALHFLLCLAGAPMAQGLPGNTARIALASPKFQARI